MKENRWVSDVHEMQNKDMKIDFPAYKADFPLMLIYILYLFRNSQPSHILCF